MNKTKPIKRLNELIKQGKKLSTKQGRNEESSQKTPFKWYLSCQNLLRYFFGAEHLFYKNFTAFAGYTAIGKYSGIIKGVEVLEHIKEEIELGLISDAQHLYEANLFSNLLEQAFELAEKGYLVGASVYCRVVIENSINDLCRVNKIENWKDQKFSQRLILLRKEGVINLPQERMIQAQYDVGSFAAHGDEEFKKYNKERILGVLEETRDKILTIGEDLE